MAGLYLAPLVLLGLGIQNRERMRDEAPAIYMGCMMSTIILLGAVFVTLLAFSDKGYGTKYIPAYILLGNAPPLVASMLAASAERA